MKMREEAKCPGKPCVHPGTLFKLPKTTQYSKVLVVEGILELLMFRQSWIIHCSFQEKKDIGVIDWWIKEHITLWACSLSGENDLRDILLSLSVCPPGLYGPSCAERCQCGDQCPCDPLTGSCSSVSGGRLTGGDALAVLNCLYRTTSTWWLELLLRFHMILFFVQVFTPPQQVSVWLNRCLHCGDNRRRLTETNLTYQSECQRSSQVTLTILFSSSRLKFSVFVRNLPPDLEQQHQNPPLPHDWYWSTIYSYCGHFPLLAHGGKLKCHTAVFHVVRRTDMISSLLHQPATERTSLIVRMWRDIRLCFKKKKTC